MGNNIDENSAKENAKNMGNNIDENNAKENAKTNLNKLLKTTDLNQAELAGKLGFSKATVNNYINGKILPTTNFLLNLKKEYDINIDEFLCSEIELNQGNSSSHTIDYLNDNFYLYYFDSSDFVGRINSENDLLYGYLSISDKISSKTKKITALLNLTAEELENVEENGIVELKTDNEFKQKYYWGTVECDDEVYSFALKNSTGKRLVFYTLYPKQHEYVGGLGTANATCSGRQKGTVVFNIGISNIKLNNSVEEIGSKLLLDFPSIEIDKEVSELQKNFSDLFSDVSITEVQRNIFLKSNLQRIIYNLIQDNLFRYSKLTEENDDSFYHLIKYNNQNLPEEEEYDFD